MFLFVGRSPRLLLPFISLLPLLSSFLSRLPLQQELSITNADYILSCVVLRVKFSWVSNDLGPNLWPPNFRNCHEKWACGSKLYSGHILHYHFWGTEESATQDHQASASSQGNPEKCLSWLHMVWVTREDTQPSGSAGYPLFRYHYLSLSLAHYSETPSLLVLSSKCQISWEEPSNTTCFS